MGQYLVIQSVLPFYILKYMNQRSHININSAIPVSVPPSRGAHLQAAALLRGMATGTKLQQEMIKFSPHFGIPGVGNEPYIHLYPYPMDVLTDRLSTRTYMG